MSATPSHHARSLLAAMIAASLAACIPPTTFASNVKVASSLGDDVRGARSLDQQGVLAFEAGRYHDALLYFEAAFAHGGPPSERWNAAKCHLRLDEPAQAEAALVEYLSLPGLTAQDRQEATVTLESIRRKSSTLTVLSVPLGLPVVVDGSSIGVTPVTTSVLPGEHLLVVGRTPETRQERPLTARYGRAILVEAHP
jgi:hypothetical protein